MAQVSMGDHSPNINGNRNQVSSGDNSPNFKGNNIVKIRYAVGGGIIGFLIGILASIIANIITA